MRASLLACLAIAAAPSVASADPDPDAPALYMMLRGDLGRLTGPLAHDWSVNHGSVTTGAGLRVRRFELQAAFELSFFHSNVPLRDTASLFGFGFGGDLGYHIPITGGLELTTRVGWRWRRLTGEAGTVKRTCTQTGGCDGGYWYEGVDYWANGAVAAIGIERDGVSRNMFFGGRVELELRRMVAGVPGFRDGLAGTYVGIGVTGMFGGTWAHHPRTAALDDAPAGTTAPGSGDGVLAIRHDDQMTSTFLATGLTYTVDGAAVFALAHDTPLAERSFDVYARALPAGPHKVAVVATFRGNAHGILSYIQAYTFRVTSTYDAIVVSGETTAVTVTCYEQGSVVTPVEQRPAIRFSLAQPRAATTNFK